MTIYTLNVGQGQFVIVTGKTDAIIIDTYVPLTTQQKITNVKGALATALDGKKLVGLMVTGFDSDHFNEVGLKIVLNKYRPEWLMYPKYFKQTDEANACFKIIEEKTVTSPLMRLAIRLSDSTKRFYTTLSSEFDFEIFSPHHADMDSSNNCSLVCAIHEKASRTRYLVTGDTETGRWDSLVRYFGSQMQSLILAAPHHGSRNGITEPAMSLIRPHTVLISAGINNSHGHPHSEPVRIFNKYATGVHCTAWNGGQSLKTETNGISVATTTFTP